MFNVLHPQITKHIDEFGYSYKIITYRYLTKTGRWKQKVDYCNDFTQVPESTQTIPMFKHNSSRCYLVQVRSRRYQNIGASTYVGFYSEAQMIEYLQKEGLIV